MSVLPAAGAPAWSRCARSPGWGAWRLGMSTSRRDAGRSGPHIVGRRSGPSSASDVYRRELDGPAQQEFADLPPAARASLATFMDAVVIVDPVQYQRRRDERDD